MRKSSRRRVSQLTASATIAVNASDLQSHDRLGSLILMTLPGRSVVTHFHLAAGSVMAVFLGKAGLSRPSGRSIHTGQPSVSLAGYARRCEDVVLVFLDSRDIKGAQPLAS